ncbi:MAG: hypothetical protein AAB479_00075 [Patescibacteria group bacterium]
MFEAHLLRIPVRQPENHDLCGSRHRTQTGKHHRIVGLRVVAVLRYLEKLRATLEQLVERYRWQGGVVRSGHRRVGFRVLLDDGATHDQERSREHCVHRSIHRISSLSKGLVAAIL